MTIGDRARIVARWSRAYGETVTVIRETPDGWVIVRPDDAPDLRPAYRPEELEVIA